MPWPAAQSSIAVGPTQVKNDLQNTRSCTAAKVTQRFDAKIANSMRIIATPAHDNLSDQNQGLCCVCRGACAIMGFVGTAVGRTAIARLGLLYAGMLATGLQAGLLLGAWAVHRYPTCI